MAKPIYSDIAFGERIEKVIEIMGGMSETARQTGISIPSISRWRDGSSDPSRTNIVKLAQASGVDLVWLSTGLGSASANSSAQISTQDHEYDHVPFYKAEASAGNGSFLDEHREPTHHLAFRHRWIKAKGFCIKDLVGLIARGDSMEPTIQNGAAIIINTSRCEAMDGDIFVVRIGERLWVKRTQWLTNGGLRLISDNKFYDAMDVTPEELASEDIEVIGQVVHTAYDLVR